MSLWNPPTVIRKMVFEIYDPETLGAELSAQTSATWQFSALDKRFHQKLDLFQAGDLWIVNVQSDTGFKLIRDDTLSPRFAVHFIERGQCRIRSDSGEYSLDERSAHLSRSRNIYSLEMEPGTSLTVIVAPSSLYARLATAFDEDPSTRLISLVPVIPSQHPVARIIRDTSRVLHAPGEPISSFEGFALSAAILKEAVFQTLLCDWPRLAATSSRYGGPNTRYVRRALEWINLHLQDKITIAELAEVAGTGPRTLQNLFKKELGVSPIQHVIKVRLMHIREELVDSRNHDTIAAIAARYGFSSPSDFERHYKSEYGQTPSQTRKSSRTQYKST